MRNFKFIILVFIVTSLLMTNICISASDSMFVWSENNSSSINTTSSNADTKTENSLNLQSGSAILIEQSTGQILYEHNIHEQLRPASVTKLMSILLIMEALDNGQITLDTKIPCSENAAGMGGSQIWLNTSESLSVNEMLKAICVVSANDYKVQ